MQHTHTYTHAPTHNTQHTQEVDYDKDGLIEVDEVRAYIRDKVGGEEFDSASEVRCLFARVHACMRGRVIRL